MKRIIGDTFGPGGHFSQDVKDLARQIEKGLAQVKGENVDQDQGSMQALEVMSEEAKLLYARILAAQSLVDGRLDPREIEYLYVFMSRIGLGAASREEVRQSLQAREVQPPSGGIKTREGESKSHERAVCHLILPRRSWLTRGSGFGRSGDSTMN